MGDIIIDLEADQKTGSYVQKKRAAREQKQQPKRQKQKPRPVATASLHQLLDGVEAGCDLIERATGIFNKYARKRDD